MADAARAPQIAVTSNEPAGEKHLVEPYADRPTVKQGMGRHFCVFCGNPGFRRSRLRFADAPSLLLLRFPVRCTRCGQRQRASLLTSLAARPPRRHAGL